jgi:nucleotidyltransferase substrate binding protein (TIGR01987 family)
MAMQITESQNQETRHIAYVCIFGILITERISRQKHLLMEQKDIRWKQRFQNFEKAFSRLKEGIEIENPNELERNGIVQRFEFTIDLSWKVMKDYLEEKGFSFKPSPKDTFRYAQENGFIDYAQALIDGFDTRNELSHDYDGDKFERSEKSLRKVIFPALKKLYLFYIREGATNLLNLFDAKSA